MIHEAAWRLLRLQEGSGPLSGTTAAALALIYLRRRGEAAVLAAAAAACFFFDPSWPFLPYVGSFCFVSALARARSALKPRARLLLLAAAALGIVAMFQGTRRLVEERRIERREADFVANSLGGGDLLITLEEPGWFFRRAVGARVPWKAAFWRPGVAPAAPHAGGLTPQLRDLVLERLRAKAAVWVSGEWIFRRAGAPSEEGDDEAARLVSWLEPLGKPGAAVRSPQGLYYYPLSHD